jgi:para-nitrobenzyl esterase
VFGAIGSEKGVHFPPEDWRLSEAIAVYWTNFAKTGNPNGVGVPEWPRYLERDNFPVMHLDVVLAPEPETHRTRHAFWDAAPTATPVVNAGSSGG